MSVNGSQLIAARGLLRWTQGDLAERSKVAASTIKRLEAMAGEVSGHAATIQAVINALEAGGIVFIDDDATSAEGGAGVRLRKEQP